MPRAPSETGAGYFIKALARHLEYSKWRANAIVIFMYAYAHIY